MKRSVLITGGSGYIGSHISLELFNHGYHPIIIDQKQPNQLLHWATFFQGSFDDATLLAHCFKEYSIETIIHCAAIIDINSCQETPINCYETNVLKTIALIKIAVFHKIKYFIFSSSCAVYGNPTQKILDENHPQNPINFYGKSKKIIEEILKDICEKTDLKALIFRYFNVAGALFQHNLGENHHPETHLIPRILEAIRFEKPFPMFGSNHPTPDGTCIRDYIHVHDIAKAHILGLNYLFNNGSTTSCNLSNGVGTSIFKIIRITQALTKKTLTIEKQLARETDPHTLIGSSEKAFSLLGFQPTYTIEEILASSIAWDTILHENKN